MTRMEKVCGCEGTLAPQPGGRRGLTDAKQRSERGSPRTGVPQPGKPRTKPRSSERWPRPSHHALGSRWNGAPRGLLRIHPLPQASRRPGRWWGAWGELSFANRCLQFPVQHVCLTLS